MSVSGPIVKKAVGCSADMMESRDDMWKNRRKQRGRRKRTTQRKPIRFRLLPSKISLRPSSSVISYLSRFVLGNPLVRLPPPRGLDTRLGIPKCIGLFGAVLISAGGIGFSSRCKFPIFLSSLFDTDVLVGHLTTSFQKTHHLGFCTSSAMMKTETTELFLIVWVNIMHIPHLILYYHMVNL